MKRVLLLFFFFLNISLIMADTISWDWSYKVRGTGSSYLTRICVTKDQGIFALGQFSGQLIINEDTLNSIGERDLFIVKMTSDGQAEWGRAVNCDNTFGRGRGSLAIDSKGSAYLVTEYSGNLTIGDNHFTSTGEEQGIFAKFSREGNLLWAKPITAGRSVFQMRIAIDTLDNIYVGGNFTGTPLLVDTISTVNDNNLYFAVMFLSQLDTSGSVRWVRTALMADQDMFGLIDIVADKQGNCYVAGTLILPTDFGNGIQLTPTMESPFVVKYNSLGTCQYGTIGTSTFGFGEASDLALTDSGDIYLTGMYLAELKFDTFRIAAPQNVVSMGDIFVMHMDTSGIVKHLLKFGSLGSGSDYGISYAGLPDRGGYLLGLFGDTLVMGADSLFAVDDPNAYYIASNIFLSRLDKDGNPLRLWSAGLHGDRQFGEIITRGNDLYMAGYSTSVTEKKGLKASSSVQTAFLGKYNTFNDTVRTTHVNTGFKEYLSEDALTIYPNPFSNYLQSNLPAGTRIRIYSLEGVMMMQTTNSYINTTSLPAGMYLLEGSRGNKIVYCRKFVKLGED